MLGILSISASALEAERWRMNTIAGNIANADATRDASGRPQPYKRKFAILESGRSEDGAPGVRVSKIAEDDSFRLVKEPWHQDADADGNVKYPNIEVVTEMVNMMTASRAYEANITAMEVTKSMINATLRLMA